MENIMNTNETTVNVATENTEVNTNTEKEMDTMTEATMNTETTATEMTDEQVLDIIKEERNFDFDNLERYDKRSLPWSVKQMVSSMVKGTARFDNTVQRTLVWNKEKKSRLIHTAILNLPCPPLYANVYTNPETGKKVYDFLDGKQRSHAFKEFLNDEFELTEVPVLVFTDGKEFNINGYKFSELPEEVQDMIKNYSLNISTMEDLNDDEVSDLFYILNNGVALTKIEVSRVKAKALDAVRQVASHPLFNIILTEKARAKYTNEDIVIKAFALLFNETGNSLENKDIRPYMERMELDEADIKGMNNLLTIVQDMYIMEMAKNTPEAKKVAKRITTRTHLISLIPYIHRGYKENRTVEDMVAWVETFFYTTNRSTTISEKYNMACKSASNSRDAVCTRDDELNDSYEAFFENYVPTTETEEVEEEVSTEEVNIPFETTSETTEEVVYETEVA